MMHQLTFQTITEDEPGPKWQAHFHRAWPDYLGWFLREGRYARPTTDVEVAQLSRHMPELMPVYEKLLTLTIGSELAARLLPLYNPTPYLTACSQAVASAHTKQARLIRNYDYAVQLCEGLIIRTNWLGTRVICASDCLWGALDGMNEHGLCVSLAFGGRNVVGEGFGIPLVLRYILQRCTTTAEGVEVLKRIPIHMPYNITILDRTCSYATVFVAPDRETAVFFDRPFATNHQDSYAWKAYIEATSTLDRDRCLSSVLSPMNPQALSPDAVEEMFLNPPLFSAMAHKPWGTLYTASYDPQRLLCRYRWRSGKPWELGFTDGPAHSFPEQQLVVTYG